MSLLPHGFGVHEQYQCTQLFLLHLPYPDFFSWRCQLGVKEKAHFWKLDTTLLEARRFTWSGILACATTDIVCDSCVFPHPWYTSVLVLSITAGSLTEFAIDL